MGHFLRKLMRNTNKIVRTQINNAPDFEANAAAVTGGKKRFNKIRMIKRRFNSNGC